jgi:hypothetical protein
MIRKLRYYLAELLFEISYFVQDLAETVGGYPVHLG